MTQNKNDNQDLNSVLLEMEDLQYLNNNKNENT
jgi:hypothetical protein